jgi:hypothetical protein
MELLAKLPHGDMENLPRCRTEHRGNGKLLKPSPQIRGALRSANPVYVVMPVRVRAEKLCRIACQYCSAEHPGVFQKLSACFHATIPRVSASALAGIGNQLSPVSRRKIRIRQLWLPGQSRYANPCTAP